MKDTIRWIKFWACILVAALLAGCAFGTRQATLIYPPASGEGGQPVSQAPALREAKATRVFVETFRDERSDKNVVGTVRNGFGMRTADVVATNSVPGWVTQAITSELKNEGFVVVDSTPGASSEANGVTVSGDILNVFCDMYMSYTGQVSFIAKVNGGNGELLNKHYAGEGSAGLAWAATAESYSQSLASALSAAVKKFIADFVARLQ